MLAWVHWALSMVFTLVAIQAETPGVQAPPVRPPAAAQGAGAGERRVEWTVDGVKREAIVVYPKGSEKSGSPVIFAFHGHGGTARYAARKFAYHELWPEAVCVYMEGLPTPGNITDPKGEKRGWQRTVGDQGDRDLKFFDAVLETVKKEAKVDASRIYCTGHSNGGAFTFLLWAERPSVFAAFAPVAAGPTREAKGKLKPKPAMHVAGKEDPLVPFGFQKRAMDEVRKLNGCEAKGKAWAKDCELFESKTGTPLVEMIVSGGHEFPKGAAALIVRFFKEQRLAVAKAETPAKKE